MYLLLQYFIKQWKSSVLYLFFPPHKLLETIGFFFLTVFIVLSFPKCHIIGLILHGAFSDLLLSLSNMHVWFLHILSRLDSLFLPITDYSIVWMYRFYPFTYWRTVDGFQVLTVMNKVVINIQVQVFWVDKSFQLLGICIPRTTMAGSYDKTTFGSTKHCQTVSQSDIFHSYLLLYVLVNIGINGVLDFKQSNRYGVSSHYHFNLHFPDDIWCRASFHMFIYHLYIFFGGVSVQILCLFFNWVFWLLIPEF